MADVAVSFAVQMLRVALGEIKHLRGVRNDMEWLHEELEWMKCFLLDAEQRSSSGDELAKKWIREIIDAAYEAEDIAAKFAPRKSLGFMATMWRYAFRLKEPYDIGNDIERLKEKVVGIGQRRDRYGFSRVNSNMKSSSENHIQELRRRPLFQNEEDVFGLENDKNKVMELLQAEESRRYVIGIVGMGGMGKTTLARQVYKGIDRREFPKTAWVDLSQNYIQNHSIHQLLNEIAKQVITNSPNSESLRTEELSELLKSNLKDERYLIVMDDMWETNVWDLIKDHLPDMKNGSRIIITTRKANVAEHPALHFPAHRMEGLDYMKSWDLFTHLVFEDAEGECTGQLKELADELVRGCGGSPLALTVLGGLLAGKEKSHSAWRKVVGNRKWLHEEAGENCLDILKLSYMDLPHHLKMCFLYLSAFPEDHKIGVEKLIRLWVAEGFVVKTDSNGEENVEDIARTYLDSLKQMCLVMVHEEFIADGSYRCIPCREYCRIHDLIRELSINEAKKANFMNSEMIDSRNGVMHRLSLQGKFSSNSFKGISRSLRTLLSFTWEMPIAFEKFYLLRVLDLEGSDINKLPKEVGDMVLLRYLSIKDTPCKSLPHSIGRLSYLETLDCRKWEMPKMYDNVWKIETLKHIYGKFILDGIDVSYIIKLQTLQVLFPLTVKFMLCSIQHMTNLQDLSISGKLIRTEREQTTMGSDPPIWKALQNLPSLKFLHLYEFYIRDIVANTTGFPSLQRLSMSNYEINSWEVEEGSLPSLEILVLHHCEKLKRLPRGLAHCKKLRAIYCHEMDDEFEEWYNRSKNDAAWEFQHVQFLWEPPRDLYSEVMM